MTRHRSLVPVRHYDTRDELFADVAALEAKGIRAEAGGLLSPDSGFTLMVHSTDLVAALDVLGDAGAPHIDRGGEACPRCQSTRGSTPLPPYLLIGLGIAFAVSLGLAQFRLWYWLAGWAVVSGLAIRRLERAHHWRCLNCHFTWNTWAEEERRAAARRAAPE